jgi:hypothetical protein
MRSEADPAREYMRQLMACVGISGCVRVVDLDIAASKWENLRDQNGVD